jgi:hypothetical protein
MNSEVVPILCPICNTPICTSIGYQCDDCVGSNDSECLQNVYVGSCNCLNSDIVNKLIENYPILFKDYISKRLTNDYDIKNMIKMIKNLPTKIIDVDELFEGIEL